MSGVGDFIGDVVGGVGDAVGGLLGIGGDGAEVSIDDSSSQELSQLATQSQQNVADMNQVMDGWSLGSTELTSIMDKSAQEATAINAVADGWDPFGLGGLNPIDPQLSSLMPQSTAGANLAIG